MMMDDDLSLQRVRPWVCVSVLCVYFFKLCKILKADFFSPVFSTCARSHSPNPLLSQLVKAKEEGSTDS